MIGNIGSGNGFGGLLTYVLDRTKQPRIISENMANDAPIDLAREFRAISNGNPRISKPAKHISVSFAPEDGEVDDLIKEAVAFRLLNGLGYEKSPYIVVGHDRDDPGHDEIHNHDHIHIVTCAVDYQGKRVNPAWEAYRMQSILREAEKDFGLRQIASSWEVKREKAKAASLNSDITRLVTDSLSECPDLKTWLDRLAQVDIDVRFNLTYKGVVRGVTYLKDDKACKGCDAGVSWQLVSPQLTPAPGDVALMEAANIKSQGKNITLSSIDQAMFDRVIEMAIMKLGQRSKFENRRAEINLDGNTLTVMRMRPHKTMVKAVRNGDAWQPVGFPNIQKKDVELLERMNKAETRDFTEVGGQSSSEGKIYKVASSTQLEKAKHLILGTSLSL
jgi:hypothetical protein